MTTEIISFRLKTEAYLRLEAIASEEGVSPGVYLKKKLESEANELVENIHDMKSDVKDILHILTTRYDDNDNEIEDTKRQQPSDDLLPLVLEALLILREIGSPNKVANAQKLVKKAGIKAYNSLEN
jgi:predicted DNA-binding protein